MKYWDEWKTREEGVEVGRHHIGKRGRLQHDAPVLCCGYVIPEGTEVEVHCRMSKRRVEVRQPNKVGCHKVDVGRLCFEGEECAHNQLPKAVR